MYGSTPTQMPKISLDESDTNNCGAFTGTDESASDSLKWVRKSMTYTIPDLFLRPASDSASSVENLTEGLPITDFESILLTTFLGQGGFGKVFLCKKKQKPELFVLKQMLDKSERGQRLLLKEARILHMLNHKNIVRFDSLCQRKEEPIFSFLLGYEQFVFPFGPHKPVSSLQDFLSSIDEDLCVYYNHLQNFIARDICAGLAYLHENNIAHRDLKPGNVLVSNQHYVSLSRQESEIMWRTQPVISKLTDFGESRGALVQTNSTLHTNTKNIFRGTIVYMAPEILKCITTEASIKGIGLEELKNMDIWSYAMVLFMLLNPDLKYPYDQELTCCCDINEFVLNKLVRLFKKQTLPCDSRKYDMERKSHWNITFEAFRFCAKFTGRPTAKEALTLIESLLDRKSNTVTLEGDKPKENSSNAKPSAVVETLRPTHYLRIEQIVATIYGQCIGEELCRYIGQCRKFVGDLVTSKRYSWDGGEFILLMQSLIDSNGVVDLKDFARKLVQRWRENGVHELDELGMNNTTYITIRREGFSDNPHKISQDVWEENERRLDDNGGVMRTSILGTLAFRHIDQVYRNAIDICKTTHFHPRCQASTVSVCIAISLMLRRKWPHYKRGKYRIQNIIDDVFIEASTCLETKEEKDELEKCLNYTCFSELQQHYGAKDFTYMCLGAGFWALKQDDFKTALLEIAKGGGDSSANCAVAGALLGCKLGSRKCFPESWLNLRYRNWLDILIQRYLQVLNTLWRNEMV